MSLLLLGWTVAGRGELGGAVADGDAEVEQLGLVAVGDHDVGRLHIAMHDTDAVGVVERGEHLAGVAENLGDGDASAGTLLAQSFAFDQLHDHDQLALVIEGVVQRGDVGMAEHAKQLDFATEAFAHLFALMLAGQQDFEGFATLRDGVAGLVDLAESALAEDADDLVITDALSDVEGHSRSSATRIAHGAAEKWSAIVRPEERRSAEVRGA